MLKKSPLKPSSLVIDRLIPFWEYELMKLIRISFYENFMKISRLSQMMAPIYQRGWL